MELKRNRREFARTKGRRESEEPGDNCFSQNSGTYTVYNSHVTCSNYSFSLVMVTPTSHFFAFHWLQFTSMCCLFPIGYLPKPTSMGGRICLLSLSSTTSIGLGDIPIIPLLILSSVGWSCQQHPPIHNTCRTWWHSGNHFVDITFGRMKLSTTSAVFKTCRSCQYITMAVKEYSIFPRTPRLEPHHEMVSWHTKNTSSIWSIDRTLKRTTTSG